MGGVSKAVEDVSKTISNVSDVIQKNPLPIIEAVAIIAAGPEVGVLFGVSEAAGTAIASAAVQAANGGDVGQIATAAATGYAGGQASGYAGAQATGAGASPLLADIAASASGSAATTALRGGTPDDILKAAAAGTVASTVGGETGSRILGSVAGQAALERTPEQIAISAGEQALGDYLKSPTFDTPPPVEAPLDQTTAEDARLARQEAKIAGSEKGAYMPEGSFVAPIEEPKQGAFLPAEPSSKMNIIPETKPGQYAYTFTSLPVKSKVGGSASTEALGQALGTTTGLTASRGAGEIEGTGTGGQRKKVWNEESLKLKDALGV
jgi:hypothetical protein